MDAEPALGDRHRRRIRRRAVVPGTGREVYAWKR
jgi:hypothetical protein